MRGWWPWVRGGLSVAIVGAGVLAAVSRRGQLADAGDRLGRLRWEWILAAVALEALSLLAFAGLQHRLLRAGGSTVGLWPIAGITLAANSMALSLPAGAAVSTAWSYDQLRQRGTERVLAAWAVLMAGALSSFALFVILATGTELAGDRGPVASLRWLALTLAAIPVIVTLGLLVLWHRGSTSVVALRLAERSRDGGGAGVITRAAEWLVHQIRLVQPSPSAWFHAFGLAVLNWVQDLGCLVAAVYAVGGHVPWRGVLVAYALAQLLVALPFTPGGLALVEGGLTAVLVAYGMRPDTALASVLVYRIVSFWGLVPVGWASYAWLTIRRHSDAGPVEIPAGVGPDPALVA